MEAAAEKSRSATVLDLQAWTYYTGFQAISKDQEILEELDPQLCPEEVMSREVELG